ncbi:PEP-utilizing enzyme [Picosynechococcus sp. OG1]|uniref:PEP-utilizing enzyme n=2 Tax=unclassified Picosynechococcus TaxID=3079910 RepID=UPI0028F3EAA6|nr:PEP-utilizing enzyme [Picosynechococcus sp. OG1]
MNLNQEQGLPPEIIYGQLTTKEDVSSSCFLQKLQGQAVSSGSVIGRVHRCLPGERVMSWSPNDILVTTYIDEHFLEHLKEVSGIITTQGGMLSQGASLARQHQIPMVANVAMALELLQPGQWVRLDGRLGQVELLDPEALSTDAN